ncbi:hypothetical protein HNQ55_000325 [Thalassotalea piscium]|uniref:Uncharacterized protein n=1 Tax=Thalassotalea piscium TaxID=1230533 RepID=A0A7X0NEI8_9GAMM|nr:hypothetical protein [Thalassotalea piscium]
MLKIIKKLFIAEPKANAIAEKIEINEMPANVWWR